ncbi:MAG: hypothetical protein COW55_00070 [Rhodobacteraceae bacterium CG17_big_fil_post_rev_8_21_14_2_50_65_11]|nr:MAG: hypothetical protein COW55_00070 [Rhodobacteraceae bacterium CG17_big_fil_post_rev_8_21_14_2_50_65_11]
MGGIPDADHALARISALFAGEECFAIDGEVNEAPRDYYVLPSIDMTFGKLKFAEQNDLALDAYRFVAIRHNLHLAETYRKLVDAGKPAKLAIAAIMRKLVILANALIRDDRTWTETAP